MASDEIAGLGLAIEVSNQGQCRVLHTIVGGAAHSCGNISPGDILIAVLDRERSPEFLITAGLDFNEVKGLISGRRGTKVTLKLQRQDSFESNSSEVYLCEDLIRSPIQPPPLPVRTTLDSFNLFSPLEMGLEGVGIVLDFKTEFPTVSSLVPGKAAKASGRISMGDFLLSVDQKSTKNKTFDEIRLMIAGPAGTFVALSFEGAQGVYEEKLLRGSVKEPSPLFDSKTTTADARNNHSILSAAPPAASMSSDLFGAKEVMHQLVEEVHPRLLTPCLRLALQRNGTKESDSQAAEAAKREQEVADRRAAEKIASDAKEQQERARKEAFETAKRAAEERILREEKEKERQKREAEERRKREADAKPKAPVAAPADVTASAAAALAGRAGGGDDGAAAQWLTRMFVGVAVLAVVAMVVSRTLR